MAIKALIDLIPLRLRLLFGGASSAPALAAWEHTPKLGADGIDAGHQSSLDGEREKFMTALDGPASGRVYSIGTGRGFIVGSGQRYSDWRTELGFSEGTFSGDWLFVKLALWWIYRHCATFGQHFEMECGQLCVEARLPAKDGGDVVLTFRLGREDSTEPKRGKAHIDVDFNALAQPNHFLVQLVLLICQADPQSAGVMMIDKRVAWVRLQVDNPSPYGGRV